MGLILLRRLSMVGGPEVHVLLCIVPMSVHAETSRFLYTSHPQDPSCCRDQTRGQGCDVQYSYVPSVTQSPLSSVAERVTRILN
jgi:hypothetical protein